MSRSIPPVGGHSETVDWSALGLFLVDSSLRMAPTGPADYGETALCGRQGARTQRPANRRVKDLAASGDPPAATGETRPLGTRVRWDLLP